MIIEKLSIKNADMIFTVSPGLASLIQKKYSLAKKPHVLLNVPFQYKSTAFSSKKILKISKNKKIILHLGNLGKGRSLHLLVDSLKYLPKNYILLFLGQGFLKNALVEKTIELNLSDRVIFHPFVPFEDISKYSSKADVGITLFEKFSLSYRYALPNKFFEYIQSHVPILSGPNTIEINKIIKEFNIGIIAPEVTEKILAQSILKLTNNKLLYRKLKNNVKKLAKEKFYWEKEKITLIKIISRDL